MNTKLTLSIESDVIASAKDYAENQGRSLSSIVEEYFKSLSSPKPALEKGFDPLVEELCGSVREPNDKSYKEVIGDAVVKKYSQR